MVLFTHKYTDICMQTAIGGRSKDSGELSVPIVTKTLAKVTVFRDT